MWLNCNQTCETFWIIDAIQFHKLRLRVKLIHGWLVQAVTFETDGGNPWRAGRWSECSPVLKTTEDLISCFNISVHRKNVGFLKMCVKYLLSPFCTLMDLTDALIQNNTRAISLSDRHIFEHYYNFLYSRFYLLWENVQEHGVSLTGQVLYLVAQWRLVHSMRSTDLPMAKQ